MVSKSTFGHAVVQRLQHAELFLPGVTPKYAAKAFRQDGLGILRGYLGHSPNNWGQGLQRFHATVFQGFPWAAFRADNRHVSALQGIMRTVETGEVVNSGHVMQYMQALAPLIAAA